MVDKNRYSVPTFSAGLKVQVQLAVARLEIFHNGKRLATHLRLFGNNKWQLNPDHYLESIQQRPEAFHGARALRRWRETWPPCLEKLLARFQESQGETGGGKPWPVESSRHNGRACSACPHIWGATRPSTLCPDRRLAGHQRWHQH